MRLCQVQKNMHAGIHQKKYKSKSMGITTFQVVDLHKGNYNSEKNTFKAAKVTHERKMVITDTLFAKIRKKSWKC